MMNQFSKVSTLNSILPIPEKTSSTDFQPSNPYTGVNATAK